MESCSQKRLEPFLKLFAPEIIVKIVMEYMRKGIDLPYSVHR